VAEGLERSAAYAEQEQLTVGLYLDRLTQLLLMSLRLAGGAVAGTSSNPERHLTDPSLWLTAGLALSAVVWQWRGGNPLPGLLLASGALTLPLFNGRFDHSLHMRYLMPLLPILYASVGSFGAFGLGLLRAAGRRAGRWATARVVLGQAAFWLLVGFLVLHPLTYLESYYRGALRSGATNAHIFAMLEQIQANQRTQQPVLIDQRLRGTDYREPNRWRLSTILQVLLAIEAVPFRLTDLDAVELTDPHRGCKDQLVVLGAGDQRRADRLISRLGLTRLGTISGQTGAATRGYGLYRFERPSGSASGADCA
jgi:hypothetical protein